MGGFSHQGAGPHFLITMSLGSSLSLCCKNRHSRCSDDVPKKAGHSGTIASDAREIMSYNETVDTPTSGSIARARVEARSCHAMPSARLSTVPSKTLIGVLGMVPTLNCTQRGYAGGL